MHQLAKKPVGVVSDEELAKDTLVALAQKHRKSISWLIRGAHALGISYIQAYRLEWTDCVFNKEKRTYTVVIKEGDSPVIHKIIENVKAQNLYPLSIWWQYQKQAKEPLSVVEVLKFIRACLDILGIALGEQTKLPVGFFEDSEIMNEFPALKT